MWAYFARRLLLVPLTFVVITFLIYAILRIVPGGPIEQAEARMRMAAMSGEGGGGSGGGRGAEAELQLTEEDLAELQAYYQLDRAIPVGYLQWLGCWPRPERRRVAASTLEREQEAFAPLLELHRRREELRAELKQALGADLLVQGGRIFVRLSDDDRTRLPTGLLAEADRLRAAGYGSRDDLLALLAEHGLSYREGLYYRAAKAADHGADRERHERAEPPIAALRLADEKLASIEAAQGFGVDAAAQVYRVDSVFRGVSQLDFGYSYIHTEPVVDLIGARMEISMTFGLTGYLLTWLICVPLGVFKALKHRGLFDAASSFLVFLGYAMPGFVVCLLLLVSLAAHLQWLPLGGHKPDDIDQLATLEALWGRVKHMLIPIAGYMVGSFASMTILMKNSLLENLSADYVRTAFAKGVSERRAVFVHALRNSLIPITSGIGHAFAILFAGSFLIEKTCNIDGLGLLGFEAIIQRDYPITMVVLTIGVVIKLVGNILSDLIWALIDPRIRFGGVS